MIKLKTGTTFLILLILIFGIVIGYSIHEVLTVRGQTIYKVHEFSK